MKFKLVKSNKYKGTLKTKLLKRVLALGVVGTMLFSFAGCGNDTMVPETNSDCSTLSTVELKFMNLDFSDLARGLEQYAYEFIYREGSEISDPVYFKYYAYDNGGNDNENRKTDGYVVEKNIDGEKVIVDASNHDVVLCSNYDTIYKPFLDKQNGKKVHLIVIKNKDGSKRIVNANNMNEILLDSYKSISDWYSKLKFGNQVFCAREVVLANGEKILIDDDDYTSVLYRGYKEISFEYINEYFDPKHGGKDNGPIDGKFRQIIKSDGTKMLVDGSDLNKVLISGYDTCSKTFYLKFYDSANGGKDNNSRGGNGHVWEFVINGQKVLYDANDLSKELIRGYETITSNQSGIVVTYKDGAIEVIEASDFPKPLEEEKLEEEQTTTEKKEEETTPAVDINDAPKVKTLYEIMSERKYSDHYYRIAFNDKEYLVFDANDYSSEVLINSETFKEIIPEGVYTSLILAYNPSCLYGISKEGNVDKIKIDAKENVVVETLLKNTNYCVGYHTRIPSKLQNNETDFVSYLVLSSGSDIFDSEYLNLDTNNIEIQDHGYNRIEPYCSDYYFVGITSSGDLHAIKKGGAERSIITIANNTGYNSVVWQLEYSGDLNNDNEIFKCILLYNEEEGRQSGELYMITDDFELKKVEEDKVKVK